MQQLFKAFLNSDEILAELKPVLESGWVGLGPKTGEFEKALSAFICPESHFLALNSCTAGLHLALRLLELPPGSKVLTTPITFVSTNHAILYEHLEPIFCDVEPLTGHISPLAIERALEKHSIAAIMVVHLGGYPCDMDRINALARARKIPVIEDCAHAFGGKYLDGTKIGATTNICVWSFQAVKNLAIGDGGAISVANPEYFSRLKRLRWLGIDQDTVSRFREKSDNVYHYKWDYHVDEVGFKYHLNDILSLIGLVQLRHLETGNARRAQIAGLYAERLSGLDGVTLPEYGNMNLSSFHFFPVFFENRAQVYQALQDKEIFPGMHYKNNTVYPMYRSCQKVGRTGSELDGTAWYESRELTLPLHLGLSDEDVHFICDTVVQALC